jgi:hypothetical protein
MVNEETREVATTFDSAVDWTNRAATIARLQTYLASSPNHAFTIKSSPIELKIRNVLNYDTATKAIAGQDAQLRVRVNADDSSDVDLTFKKKSPFKSYACSTEVWPATKYEDDASCKCEQDVSWAASPCAQVTDIAFVAWYQHACSIDRKSSPSFQKVSDVEQFYPQFDSELGLGDDTPLVVSSNICWYQPVFSAVLEGVDIEYSLVMRYPNCNLARAGTTPPISVDGEFKIASDAKGSFQNHAAQFVEFAVSFPAA